MKKLLLTATLLSLAPCKGQEIYNSYGYERLMYGFYYPSSDGWELPGNAEKSYKMEITDNGFDNSDMCLNLWGSEKSGENTEMSTEIFDAWAIEATNGNHVLNIDLDIKNNTPEKSNILNTLYLELLHRDVDKYGNEKFIALYGLSFNAATGDIRPQYGKDGNDIFSNIGGRNSPLTHKANPNEWLHLRLSYNVKTGYAEMVYGNQNFIETGNGRADGRSMVGNFIDIPSDKKPSTSQFKDKNPGLFRMSIRSTGKKDANLSSNNTPADFMIDNLSIMAQGLPKTLSDGVFENYNHKNQRAYIDSLQQLQIPAHYAVSQILVFDTQAKLVASQQNSQSINLAQLNPGVYVVKYNDGQHMHSQRIIK
jgi:Secretion system C-terminal sorting domain